MARTAALVRSPWALPVAVVTAITGAFLVQPLLAAAADDLPEVTAEDLMTRVLDAEPLPLSGTVVHTARLGLPELPVGEMGGADPLQLLFGSTTMRVWTDGVDRSRVALLGMASEYSVVTDGPEAWTYSSSDNEVVHYTVDEADLARWQELADRSATDELPTPAEAARRVLEKADEDATVALADPVVVAGRAAYQLVVTPDGDATLVDRIAVAIDGETLVPLRVQTWSVQDDGAPSLEIGFTDISFATPADSVLAFTPPAGAAVRDVVVPLPSAADAAVHDTATEADRPDVVTSGTGWETVVEVRGADITALLAGDPAALADPERLLGSAEAQDLLGEFTPDRESFALDALSLYEQLTTPVPEGRLLSSTLLSVLVTDDGRVFLGAVPPETLRASL